MAELAINTHTLYAHYARQLKKANEDLQNVRKYLEIGSPNNYEKYIVNLRAIKPPPADINTRIATAEAQLKLYQETEQKARAAVAEFLPLLQGLQAGKDFWGAPDAKLDEYMHILDEETCQSTCADWVALANACQAGLWGTTLNVNPAGCPPYTFANRQISYTGINQTDGVRIWNHNVVLDSLSITDPRSYVTAHRDAIQLIPPPKYQDGVDKSGKPTKIKLADQMVGTILENPIVRNCTVNAPNGPLQGIFTSDGLCRNVTISNNDITVGGAHTISLAGVLSGAITGNTLHELPAAPKQAQQSPRIRLFPLRIGGNMADDGVVCIFGFAAGNSVSYGQVTDSGNRVVRLNGSSETLAIEDLRKELPEEFRKIGAGLQNFNYDQYFKECSTWTVNDFKVNDAWGYSQMVAWVSLRLQEYSSGQREVGSLLPVPSDEQRFGVGDMLQKAKTALQGNAATFLNTRLADLQETAIRSFSMKRIAIKNGTVVPLYDIGEFNGRREAMLKWLLKPEELANIVPNPNPDIAKNSYIAYQIVDKDGGLPVPYLPYTISFEDGSEGRSGYTDGQGQIHEENVPNCQFYTIGK